MNGTKSSLTILGSNSIKPRMRTNDCRSKSRTCLKSAQICFLHQKRSHGVEIKTRKASPKSSRSCETRQCSISKIILTKLRSSRMRSGPGTRKILATKTRNGAKLKPFYKSDFLSQRRLLVKVKLNLFKTSIYSQNRGKNPNFSKRRMTNFNSICLKWETKTDKQALSCKSKCSRFNRNLTSKLSILTPSCLS